MKINPNKNVGELLQEHEDKIESLELMVGGILKIVAISVGIRKTISGIKLIAKTMKKEN